MVVDVFGPSAGLDDVPHIAVGPEAVPDCRCGGSGPLPTLPMLRRGWIRGVCGWCSDPPALRALERSRALRLLHRRRLEQRFSCWRTRRSSEVATSGHPRSSMAVVARFCDARLKSGGASVLASALAPSLARRSLSRVGPRAGGVGAPPRDYSAAERRSVT
jgi:hypothetical protein